MRARIAFACFAALGALAGPVPAAPPGTEPPPVHHELDVRLDPARQTLVAVDRVQLAPEAPRSFRLAEGLTIDELDVNGRRVSIDPRAGVWNLDRPGRLEVSLTYHGRLPADPSRNGDGLEVGESGTFLAGGAWYPAFEGSLLSFDLSVSVPPGQVAVAPGRIVAEETNERGSRARFASEAPMEDIVLFAGPYRVTERRHGRILLRTYLHAEVADLAELYLGKTADYLDLYEAWIGEYPFSSFHVVAGELPVGLGFPGLTCIGKQVLRLPFLPDTSLGHEVLHNWWGNGVLIDASGGNWAEGLTTFMADYAYAERKGEEAAREMRQRWLVEVAVLPPERDRPLTSFRSRRHTASQVVGYHKAAMVFLMLRDEIGRAAFDDGIRRFWKENRSRLARWSDLEAAFAAAAGRDLGDFFAEWVERTGAPRLELGPAAASRADGGFAVSFEIRQGEPPYRLRVPVEIDDGSGVRGHSVVLDSGRHGYTIRLDSRPLRLRIDPELRLFRRLLPDEVPPILRAVAFDPHAATLIAAGDESERAAARDLAARFFEATPRIVAAGQAAPPGPLLVVGTDGRVAEVLATEGIGPPPEAIAGRGSARAWAARRRSGEPAAVVSARDAAALRAVTEPLPHHGSQSYVAFDGRHAIERGVLAPAGGALTADLSGSFPSPPPVE